MYKYLGCSPAAAAGRGSVPPSRDTEADELPGQERGPVRILQTQGRRFPSLTYKMHYASAGSINAYEG